MRAPKNIQNISSWLALISLAILLLVLPCKVRNYVQAKLGIPQTEVANKSKVTISNSNCSTYAVANTTVNTTKSSIQYLPVLAIENAHFAFNAGVLSNKSVHPLKKRNHAVAPVPLYILYKNFKVYL